MKKVISYSVTIALILILCFGFYLGISSYKNHIIFQITTLSADDIVVTAVDDNTLRLENTVSGLGLAYRWNVVSDRKEATYIYDYQGFSGESAMEFHYEDLSQVKFRPFISFDGNIYQCFSYTLNEDLSLAPGQENDTQAVTPVESVSRDIGDVVSLAFVCFLALIALLYYVVPKKIQWIVLLLSSIFFYLVADVNYIIFILVSVTTTYCCAKKMTKNQETAPGDTPRAKKANAKVQNKFHLTIGLISTLGILLLIKYTNFVLANINGLLGLKIPFVELLMPLGLSFYTFMILGYLIDVYRGKYPAEHNYFRFFLFASFFPHVSQGPIARYNQLGPILKEHHKFDYDQFTRGCQRILWGFFIKLVLADRVAIFVNEVYNQYETQSFFMIGLAMLVYSLQIYADFYSSMEIAIGSAQLLGIPLQDNFLRPNFATSMPDFWRRWHATLGTWFKDYVFYPVSTSKSMMKLNGKVRKSCSPAVSRGLLAIPPIFAVWILTGLWHGSSWNFVIWGLFHGLLIWMSATVGPGFTKGLDKLGVKTQSWDYKVLQMGKVYLLCTIARVFFRTSSLSMALDLFRQVLTFQVPGRLLDLSVISLGQWDFIWIVIATGLLLAVGIIQEKIGSVRQVISQANIWIRWPIWLFLLGATLAFGIYGQGTVTAFVYGNF